MVDRGHRVTVITGIPNYPTGRFFSGYPLKLRQWEELDGVRILRLPLYPDHSSSSVKRAACYLSFALTSSCLGALLVEPADIAFVYHPLTLGITAWWIGLVKKVPYIFNIQDMYPESLTSTGLVTNGFVVPAVARLAKFIYDKAAAVAVISPGFRKNLIEKGIPEHKIQVVLNWADESIYHPVRRDTAMADEFGFTGHFNILYAGSMGPPQGLHNLLKAASLLRDIPDLQFVLIGDGLERPMLEATAAELGLRNVRFLHRQPASRMPAFYALADALLVHLIDDPLFEITIPSKTQSYLACGRPLLTSVKGDAADLAVSAGAAVTAQPSDPVDLARAAMQLYEMNPAQRQRMGEAGRKFFLENLTMNRLLDEYEDLFRRMARDKRRTRRTDSGQFVCGSSGA
jgi:glycosyltransferase involved in cell wall biosynthesis